MKIIILCGIPGSGKSHFTKDFDEETTTVVSADFLFQNRADMLGVSYNEAFNPADLPEAHAQCLRRFTEIVARVDDAPLSGEDYEADQKKIVVVDNTNITAVEMAPYVALAQAYGHDVEIHLFKCDPEVAFERNTHGVSKPVIKRMAAALEERELPPWWSSEVVHFTDPHG
jgi:predicted kinase